jgi:hypothetical protein
LQPHALAVRNRAEASAEGRTSEPMAKAIAIEPSRKIRLLIEDVSTVHTLLKIKIVMTGTQLTNPFLGLG